MHESCRNAWVAACHAEGRRAACPECRRGVCGRVSQGYDGDRPDEGRIGASGAPDAGREWAVPPPPRGRESDAQGEQCRKANGEGRAEQRDGARVETDPHAWRTERWAELFLGAGNVRWSVRSGTIPVELLRVVVEDLSLIHI